MCKKPRPSLPRLQHYSTQETSGPHAKQRKSVTEGQTPLQDSYKGSAAVQLGKTENRRLGACAGGDGERGALLVGIAALLQENSSRTALGNHVHPPSINRPPTEHQPKGTFKMVKAVHLRSGFLAPLKVWTTIRFKESPR